MGMGREWIRSRGPCQQHRLLFWEHPHGYHHCNFCGEEIGGVFYCCVQLCDKSYCHKSCFEEASEKIEHFFHPQHTLFLHPPPDQDVKCDACGTNSKNTTYRCSLCSFCIDFKCSKLKPLKSSKEDLEDDYAYGHGEVVLPTHPHPLLLCEHYNKGAAFTFRCGICYCFRDGQIYACLECHVLLHKSCAELPREISHPFHPSHPLTLFPCNDRSFKCYICHRMEYRRFNYQCQECEFHLDIHCASLMHVIDEEGNQQITLLPAHSHPLIHFYDSYKDMFYKGCYGCMGDITPTTDLIIYYCCECKVFLHQSCAKLPREIKCALDPLHLLTLDRARNLYSTGERIFGWSPYEKCRICRDRLVMSFVYRCPNCDIVVDPKCALSLFTTMISTNHRHPLVLLHNPDPDNIVMAKCNKCHKDCKTPFLSCGSCNLDLHVYCLPSLPATVKSIHHRHLLTLTHSPIKDYPGEEDAAEFYCDNCERPRNLHEPTYFCERCHFVAHVHCMLTEVARLLKEEWLAASKHDEDPKVEMVIDIHKETVLNIDRELANLRDKKIVLDK